MHSPSNLTGGSTPDAQPLNPPKPLHTDTDTDTEADNDDIQPQPTQVALDLIDEAGMESFPCSDPPSYVRCHA